jgi:hypothetical protein
MACYGDSFTYFTEVKEKQGPNLLHSYTETYSIYSIITVDFVIEKLTRKQTITGSLLEQSVLKFK